MPRILLIDDDPSVLRSLSNALASAGFDVDTASDGLEGMAKYRLSRPDLILTDIIMPNQEGIGLIVELRRTDREIPIIALSGGGRTRNMQFLDMAAKLGATATLRKPVRLAELLSTVQDCLEKPPGTEPSDGQR